MDPLDRLFARWTEDLAPGLPDRSRAAGDRILYRTGEDRAAARRPAGFRGDEMSVDLGQMRLVVDEAGGKPKSGGDELMSVGPMELGS